MRTPRFFIALTSIVLLISCSDQANSNLATAQKTYDRLEVGMSHKDACWYAGTTCQEDHADHSYAIDIGQSFSKKEYTVTLSIREGKLVRVQIIKPRYEGGVRQGTEGEVIAQKGN